MVGDLYKKTNKNKTLPDSLKTRVAAILMNIHGKHQTDCKMKSAGGHEVNTVWSLQPGLNSTQ